MIAPGRQRPAAARAGPRGRSRRAVASASNVALIAIGLGLSVVGCRSAVDDGGAARPNAFGAYRTAFDEGDAGWSQFKALAAPSLTAAGRTFEVLAMLVDVRGSAAGVYFIPSAVDGAGRRSIHYDFSHALLRRQARAWTRLSFDAFTYGVDAPSQLAPILTWYPDRTLPADAHGAPTVRPSIAGPVALRFAPNARVAPDDIVLAHRLLAARMPMLRNVPGAAHDAPPANGPGARLVYIPNDLAETSRADAMTATLHAAGVRIARATDLNAGQRFQALNPAVAVGRLRVVAAADIAGTTGAGGVGGDDIVILDDLPLDLPIVAGTITQRLQTTLAHVNVLARARGTPNMALLDAARDPRVAPFIGHLIRLEVSVNDFAIRRATQDEARAFAASRRPAPLDLPAADVSVKDIRRLDDIGFADAASVGAKAANLAELHRLLPDVAPGGLAVPFGAYDAHLASIVVTIDDCAVWRTRCEKALPISACGGAATTCRRLLPDSRPLPVYIDALLDDPSFATDSALRAAALHGIRTAIERAPADEAVARSLVDAARTAFGDHAFRLRSSTNAEDLPGFSGAGLYDSVTATVDPGDDYAPERIRKVWASTWSFRAFEERTWWGVPHRAVHMGVLASRAYPDEDANGVLVTTNLIDPGAAGYTIDVQPGELSVTNATDGAFPEVLVVRPGWLGGWRVDRRQWSSASADRPVLRPHDVEILADAARRAQRHFAGLYGVDRSKAAYEIEFKLDGRSPGVVLKQIRPFAAP